MVFVFVFARPRASCRCSANRMVVEASAEASLRAAGDGLQVVAASICRRRCIGKWAGSAQPAGFGGPLFSPGSARRDCAAGSWSVWFTGGCDFALWMELQVAVRVCRRPLNALPRCPAPEACARRVACCPQRAGRPRSSRVRAAVGRGLGAARDRLRRERRAALRRRRAGWDWPGGGPRPRWSGPRCQEPRAPPSRSLVHKCAPVIHDDVLYGKLRDCTRLYLRFSS